MPVYVTQNTTKWGPVLTALYRANKYTSPAELAELSGQDHDTVMASLAFLLKQRWVEKLADDEKYACVYEARAVLQRLEKTLRPS